MAMSTWLTLAAVCLLFVALGLWVVSQIFPSDHARTPARPHRTLTATRTATRTRRAPQMNTNTKGHDHGVNNHQHDTAGSTDPVSRDDVDPDASEQLHDSASSQVSPR